MKDIVFFLLLLCCCSQASARILEVGADKAFLAIRPALSACTDGDTVLVHSGFYKEGNLIVSRSIYLLGRGFPVLDGDYKYEVLSIKASHVQVSGFQIQHSGVASLDDPGGIKVYECLHVTISDNILLDNFFGIYLQYSKHCRVEGNIITGSGRTEQEIGNGIHCWKSDSLQILTNQVRGHRDGIYFEFVTHSIIWRNVAERNIRYGLHFMFSNNDTYIANIFRSNGAGVAVMFSKSVYMHNNIFDENWGDAAYGLLLKEISDGHLCGNYFTGNTIGIFMEGANRMLMEKNWFEGNGWAFKIQASCMDNRIVWNSFLANTFDVATNGSTILNVFEHNYWDKYEGYDLNKDGTGDVPFRPLSMYGVISEQIPSAMLLYRSFLVMLLEKSERVFPTLTPDNFMDTMPRMRIQ
jgi:nitrous oxidase accessory protein